MHVPGKGCECKIIGACGVDTILYLFVYAMLTTVGTWTFATNILKVFSS